MSRTRAEKNGNGGKCEVSVWTRAITANSEWPDKVNITFENFSFELALFKKKKKEKKIKLALPPEKNLSSSPFVSDCRRNFST